MTAIEHVYTVDRALSRLGTARMIEIGPQSNYVTEMLRMDAYRWAKRSGKRVTTSTERLPEDPFMSVLRVRLLDEIEAQQAREIERYRGALTTIREQHGICERGELCCRGACRTCYEVWQVADTALRGEAASDA